MAHILPAGDADVSEPPQQEVLLEVRNLNYTYPRHHEAVMANLNVEIERHSFSAIVGRSGCGKTTLLNLLCGYLTPNSGTCRFEGGTVDAPSPRIIPIFQVDGLLPWLTVEENVMLFARIKNQSSDRSENRERANSLLAKVGLSTHIAERYPKSLSEGMKKRVEIARALFARPKLIIADEPFSGLDLDTRESLHQLVMSIWREEDVTIVFSTHDVNEALYLASSVIVLRPTPPTFVAGEFPNRFQGASAAQRVSPEEYYPLYDAIRAAMR